MNIYEKYVFNNLEKEYLKNKIYEIDNNLNDKEVSKGIYVATTTKTIINPELFKGLNEELTLLKEKLENEKLNFKEIHKNYYRQQISLPSSDYYRSIINDKIGPYTKNYSLEEIVDAYKYCNQELKNIKNEDLNEYCTEIREMLNYEHREEYNNFIENTKNKLGIPSDEELIKNYPYNKITKRIKTNRIKVENSLLYDNLYNKYEEILEVRRNA